MEYFYTLADEWPDINDDYLVLVGRVYEGFPAIRVAVQTGVTEDGFPQWGDAYWVFARAAHDHRHGHPFLLGYHAGHNVWIHEEDVILYATPPDPREWIIGYGTASRTVADEIKQRNIRRI